MGMRVSDPANFYTGLVAELYEPLASGISDSDRFIKFAAAKDFRF